MGSRRKEPSRIGKEQKWSRRVQGQRRGGSQTTQRDKEHVSTPRTRTRS